MTDGREDSGFLFFLPKLKERGADIKLSPPGEWDVRPSGDYQKIAQSLDLQESDTQLKSVTAIPNIWARALFVETALHTLDYPSHQAVVEQWQGMLAAIALAEWRQFPLKVRLVKLQDHKDRDGFARSLWNLMPEPEYALYALNDLPLQEYNPWQDLYIVLWNEQTVGMTSPSTLVCPSDGGDWGDLPWYDQKERRLLSPLAHINNEEKARLGRWLEYLGQKLPAYRGSDDARATITRLLEEYRRRLLTQPPPAIREEELLSDSLHYFEQELNIGALELLNRPIKAPSQPSSVRIVPSLDKADAPELLLIDLDLDKKWNVNRAKIWVYADKTLATRNLLEDLRQKNIIWKDGRGREVKWIESEDLLLKEFYFVRKENALRNSLALSGADKLVFDGRSITPLIPLNPILLDYFSHEDLKKRLKLKMSADSTQVVISLDLPLSGMSQDQPPKNYHFERSYPLKADNALTDVPILEIWPNFQASGWQEYYGFYFDQAKGEETFQIEFEGAKIANSFQEGKGVYQISQLSRFPTSIHCQKKSRKPSSIGLILLDPPQVFGEIDGGSWQVGVDFGTSFTNVYVNQNGSVDRLKLEGLNLQVTALSPDIRRGVLTEFFTPDEAELLELPLASILTTRIKPAQGNNESRQPTPHIDGCIYLPDSSNALQPQKNYIRTGLKWSEEPTHRLYTKLFLKHLALKIIAQAKKNNITQIEWFISYPSSFSISDQNTYSDNWNSLTRELEAMTGVRQISPKPGDAEHWRTESIAIAQYFADAERQDLVYSTCVDIGGGTADISIWENYELRHQCSLKLAGYQLLTQFLELRPAILQEAFGVTLSDWNNLHGFQFSAKLDVLLRWESEKWLRDKRDTVAKNPAFQGLLQLMALGAAGLYYYVGILLRVLHTEGKYSRQEITPMYLGGNGARFLHWLSEGGNFDENRMINRVLTRMLVAGSGFPPVRKPVATHLSQRERIKDEVACGLVMNHSTLHGRTDEEMLDERLIAGEFCRINGQDTVAYARLPISAKALLTINDIEIPDSFHQLSQFVEAFDKAVAELQITGIKPIKLSPDDLVEVSRALKDYLLRTRGKDSKEIQIEPPFILALKSLLKVLGNKWKSQK